MARTEIAIAPQIVHHLKIRGEKESKVEEMRLNNSILNVKSALLDNQQFNDRQIVALGAKCTFIHLRYDEQRAFKL